MEVRKTIFTCLVYLLYCHRFEVVAHDNPPPYPAYPPPPAKSPPYPDHHTYPPAPYPIKPKAKSSPNYEPYTVKDGPHTVKYEPYTVAPVPSKPKSPKSCDICNKITTKFSNSFYYVDEIHKKVDVPCPHHEPYHDPHHDPHHDTPTLCDSGAMFVYGPSVNKGTDESVAECPDGTTAIGCRCSDERGPECQGVRLLRNNCRAMRNKDTGGSIRAIALCAQDPKGKYSTQRDPVRGFAKRPVASCPSKTQIIACWLKNDSFGGGSIRASMNVADGTCQPSARCNSRRGCQVHAICEKIPNSKRSKAKCTEKYC